MSTKIGTIAEKEFELVCLKRNIPIFTPVVDDIGVDYVIQRRNKLLRIQVKSTIRKDPARNTYKINVVKGFDSRKYDKGAFDILVVYIFEISTYYIIPENIITGKCIRVNPDSVRGKYNLYKERWDLLK